MENYEGEFFASTQLFWLHCIPVFWPTL